MVDTFNLVFAIVSNICSLCFQELVCLSGPRTVVVVVFNIFWFLFGRKRRS